MFMCDLGRVLSSHYCCCYCCQCCSQSPAMWINYYWCARVVVQHCYTVWPPRPASASASARPRRAVYSLDWTYRRARSYDYRSIDSIIRPQTDDHRCRRRCPGEMHFNNH